jgi:arylsulfatase A-like enzyme
MVFFICAIPFVIIALARRNGVPARLRAWFWSGLAVFSVLILFTRFHSIAWIIVALGAGHQISSWAAAHPRQWTRGLWAAGIALGFGFTIYDAALIARRWGQEQRLMGALPNAGADAPNVLLIIWDTVRAANLSLYGYARPTTPVLDSLAPHSVIFTHAYSTAPWTLPSHASMLTGQYANAQSGDWTTPLDGAHRTLAEELYANGYSTGAFVANIFAAGYQSGLHRGFVRYEDTKRSLSEAWWSTTLTQSRAFRGPYQRIVSQRWYGQAVKEFLTFDFRPFGVFQSHDMKYAESITDAFLDWEAKTRRPYFAMLNYMEAHVSQAAPTANKFGNGALRQDAYDGAIWWLDHELERLSAELRRRGTLDNSVIIVTADHGELFGEHGLNAHGNSLYEQVLHVPLVIYAPGRLTGGVRIDRAVSLRDLARTIQDLAGVRTGLLPGASLAALAKDSTAATSPVLAHVSKEINRPPRNPIYWGNMSAMLNDTLHVIRDGRGRIEAFAYRRDTSESDNLARDSARKVLLERLLDDALQRGAAGASH